MKVRNQIVTVLWAHHYVCCLMTKLNHQMFFLTRKSNIKIRFKLNPWETLWSSFWLKLIPNHEMDKSWGWSICLQFHFWTQSTTVLKCILHKKVTVSKLIRIKFGLKAKIVIWSQSYFINCWQLCWINVISHKTITSSGVTFYTTPLKMR